LRTAALVLLAGSGSAARRLRRCDDPDLDARWDRKRPLPGGDL